MSQYLNIYIKVKGQDKPLFFTQYSRNSEVYDIVCEEMVVPYSSDGNTYCDLTCMALSDCLAGLEAINKTIEQKIATRMKALVHTKDQKVAGSIIEELDEHRKYISEMDEEIEEISHLLWIARQIADCKSYSWGNFEGLMANIG